MESLVDDALSREEEEVEQEGFQDSETDEELKEVLESLKTNIYIVGLGGAGCNTIDRVSEEGIHGAELIAGNTDAQDLLTIRANRKVLMGKNLTKGLGAGAKPEVGEKAAQESQEKFEELLEDGDIVFLTCGLGGGTGTGSIETVARVAKDAGALTIAVLTKPFSAEGDSRMENARWGIKRIRSVADTVILIPNDKLLELVPRLPLNKAFKVADEVLMRAIKGMTEIITKPGLVNLDYNDLRTIMQGAGQAMIGMGESDAGGDKRADEAIDSAVNSPLLDVDISGASGVLVNVTGPEDMSVHEAEMAAEKVENKAGVDANIIWGCSVDPTLEETLKVMLVATGVESEQILGASEGKKKEGIKEVK
ncbi:MAG: cell division protein FtsZ [Candidatus Thermoplasmatota archaeon]|nr:cell division protein FtsZ [Candidatus Thermoplasmatota archaeon]